MLEKRDKRLRATFVDMLCSNIEVEKGYLNKRISESINWLDNGYGKESRRRVYGKTKLQRLKNSFKKLRKLLKTKKEMHYKFFQIS